MGMSFNPMYQPTSTKTITVDGDLDLNPYDVLATDGKFDTVEADEFVGGVGNFSSLTSAGNIVLNGDTDVKGLLHAEENLQVDGNLLLEGSINNVNISDNGEITTSQGVNGADFNGAKITSTKFNGATIDTSGNVTGVKGTFSGAVTGAMFNGHIVHSYVLKTYANNSANIEAGYLYGWSISGTTAAQSTVILNAVASGTTSLKTTAVKLQLFEKNRFVYPDKVINVDSTPTFALSIQPSSQTTNTITLSGGINKTVTFSNTSNVQYTTLTTSELNQILTGKVNIKASSAGYFYIGLACYASSACYVILTRD